MTAKRSHKDFKIYVLHGIPRAEYRFIIAHELMHIWLFKNGPEDMSPILTEGSCQLAGILALEDRQDEESAMIRKQAMQNKDPIYGEGLRQVDAYVNRVGISAWLEYLKSHKNPPW